LYHVLGIQDLAVDAFGIPFAEEDSLRIEPLGWSDDGERLWLTVTPLRWMGWSEYRYELGPRQAAVVELSEKRVEFSVVFAAPDLDFSFADGAGSEISSSAYAPTFCP
jgi:hypothetical protein